MKRIGKTLSIILLCFGSAVAADFQISASLDRAQAALNEQARLSVTVSGAGSDLPTPQIPALADFQIYPAGRSQNFSWINGKASASITFNYVLTPLKEGRYAIGPIRVEKDGQTAEAPAMNLEVTSSPAATGGGSMDPRLRAEAPSGAQARQRHSEVTANQSGPAAIFITGTVDKTTAYVGEQITYTFRLYNRVALMRQPSYQAPETAGFWSEELGAQRSYQSNVQGVPYQVIEIRTALFPTAPGRVRIGPAGLRVLLENVGSDPFSPDFFSSFFGRGEEKMLRTEPISIQVKALPEPKPASFKGAVGRYTLKASLDKPATTVGQAVTLLVAVSGSGHVKSLPEIEFPALNNFRTLTDNAVVSLDKEGQELRGSKTFKTVLIPTTSGALTVPAIRYEVFDPGSKAYRTLVTEPLSLSVKAGTAATANTLGSDSVKNVNAVGSDPAIQRLGDDIRYIRQTGAIDSQSEPLVRQRWFVGIHVLGALALMGFGFWRLYERFFLSNQRLLRFRTAAARALKDLQATESALNRGDVKEAAGGLAETLQTFLADKLGLESRELSLRQVLAALRAAGLPDHNGEKIRSLWETLDLFRFAPAQIRPEEVRQAKDTLQHLIENLEKAIVWKNA